MNQNNYNTENTEAIEKLLELTSSSIKAPRSLISKSLNAPVTNPTTNRFPSTTLGRGLIEKIKTLLGPMNQKLQVYVPALLIAVAIIAGGSYYAYNRGSIGSTGNQVNSSQENIDQEQEEIAPEALPVENTVKDIQASLDIEDSLAEDSSADFAAAKSQDDDIINDFESEADDDIKF